MSFDADPTTGARGRTRSAILGAAASVLARDRTATLPDIAAAAGVGRTTLHRYFPDRETLVMATTQDAIAAVQRSVVDAALTEGAPLEAMRRAVAALVSVGDRLLFLFGDPRVLPAYATAGGRMPTDDPVIALIERGQADGVLDAHVSAQWIQHVLWALVYRGCEDADRGELPRHGVVPTVVRTLESGIRTR
jgi:AcrR family transcriptional regulator